MTNISRIKKIGIPVAVISGIATICVGICELTGFNVAKALYKLLVLKVQVWIFCVVIIIVVGIKNLLTKRSHRKKQDHFVFATYTEDVFYDIMYRWEYVCSGGKPALGRISAYCAKCKCPIINKECQVCGAAFVDIKDRAHIEAMIRYKIEEAYKVNEFTELESDSNV